MRIRPALASVGTLALLAAPSVGSPGPTASHPVSVGSVRIAAGPLTAVDRRIEGEWLRAEARSLGLPSRPAGLKARVADALAGKDGRGIPSAFVRFHERHRAATRCLAAFHDPYADRCVDHEPARAGTCRWMGAASLCGVRTGPGRRVWIVVRKRPPGRRFSGRGDAIAAVRSIYLRERAARERAARRARIARAMRARAAERRRLRLRRAAAQRLQDAARRARIADPQLSDATLARAARACVLHREDVEPYSFGLGMQDPEGQAEGLIVGREFLAARLRRAAAGRIDRAKLRPFLRSLAAGDAELRRMRAAAVGGELDTLYRSLSRYDAVTRREARLAARLGIRDCAG